MGDFNQVLSLSETYSLSPSSVSLHGIADFRDCLVSEFLKSEISKIRQSFGERNLARYISGV